MVYTVTNLEIQNCQVKHAHKKLTWSPTYGVRGEVQVAAINGTTDAVCYSVIDSPGQQSGVTKPIELKTVPQLGLQGLKIWLN